MGIEVLQQEADGIVMGPAILVMQTAAALVKTVTLEWPWASTSSNDAESALAVPLTVVAADLPSEPWAV